MSDRDRILNMLGWGAFALAASVFLLPVLNPDIYWHLSAGRYTLAHFGPPRTDFISWPMAGKEWVDFEWLPQVLYYLLYKAGGFTALYLLKVLTLTLTLLVFRATALLYGRRAALPFLLPFFAAAIMSNCDLRPDNFTLLFFSITLYFLEKSRLAAPPEGWKVKAAVFAFFALWANIHAGYLYGLALLGFYAAGEFFALELPYIYGKGPFLRPAKSLEYLKLFFLGLAASFLNPYGWKVYSVIANHQKYMSTLQDHIREWGSFDLTNPYHCPSVLVLAGVMGCFVLFLLRRRHVIYSHFAALLFFAWASSNYSRHIPFFVISGLVFAVALPWEKPAPALRWRVLGWGGAALWLAAAWWFYSGLVWPKVTGQVVTDQWGSEGMAAYLRANKAELSGLRLYNYWSWGGWLGWELGPDYKPFIDGRYLFHDKIDEVTGLRGNVEKWTELLGRYKFGLVLIQLDEPKVPVKQRLADGTEAVFWRPTYLFYMPRRDWAVVYWDYSTAALVRRSAVPAAWLASHELRYLRPGDSLNLPAPLLAGEIPLHELRRELDVYLRGHSANHDKSVNGEVISFMKQLEALCAQKGAKCAK